MRKLGCINCQSHRYYATPVVADNDDFPVLAEIFLSHRENEPGHCLHYGSAVVQRKLAAAAITG